MEVAHGSNGQEVCYDGDQTADGGYIFYAQTPQPNGQHADIWLVKLDETGNILWEQTYGGDQSDEHYGGALTDDGGYIIVGGTSHLVLKIIMTMFGL